MFPGAPSTHPARMNIYEVENEINMGRKGMERELPLAWILLSLITVIMATSGCLSLFEKDDDPDINRAERLNQSFPEIITVEGELNDEGLIEMVFLYVGLYGDDGVVMMDIVIHVVATPNGGTSISRSLIFDPNAIDPRESEYTVDEIHDPLDQWNPEGTPASFIFGEDATLRININLTLSTTALPPDSTLEISILFTISGHETYDHYRTPASYPSEGTLTLED